MGWVAAGASSVCSTHSLTHSLTHLSTHMPLSNSSFYLSIHCVTFPPIHPYTYYMFVACISYGSALSLIASVYLYIHAYCVYYEVAFCKAEDVSVCVCVCMLTFSTFKIQKKLFTRPDDAPCAKLLSRFFQTFSFLNTLLYYEAQVFNHYFSHLNQSYG